MKNRSSIVHVNSNQIFHLFSRSVSQSLEVANFFQSLSQPFLASESKFHFKFLTLVVIQLNQFRAENVNKHWRTLSIFIFKDFLIIYGFCESFLWFHGKLGPQELKHY